MAGADMAGPTDPSNLHPFNQRHSPLPYPFRFPVTNILIPCSLIHPSHGHGHTSQKRVRASLLRTVASSTARRTHPRRRHKDCPPFSQYHHHYFHHPATTAPTRRCPGAASHPPQVQLDHLSCRHQRGLLMAVVAALSATDSASSTTHSQPHYAATGGRAIVLGRRGRPGGGQTARPSA